MGATALHDAAASSFCHPMTGFRVGKRARDPALQPKDHHRQATSTSGNWAFRDHLDAASAQPFCWAFGRSMMGVAGVAFARRHSAVFSLWRRSTWSVHQGVNQ